MDIIEDVPKQYKNMVDKNISNLMNSAKDLMAVAQEIGDDNIEIEGKNIIVRILPKTRLSK